MHKEKLPLIYALFCVSLVLSSCSSILLEGTKVLAENSFEFPSLRVDDEHSVLAINSAEEMQEFVTYYQNIENFQIEYEQDNLDFLNSYTEDYFSKFTLILGSHWEGSGSIGVSLYALRKVNDELVIHLKRAVPQLGTADMRYWPFGFDIKKSYGIQTAKFAFHSNR